MYVRNRGRKHERRFNLSVSCSTSGQALSEVVDKEQSGAVAAAETSRREAEAKAKEELDLVNACQVRLFFAKGALGRVRRYQGCFWWP